MDDPDRRALVAALDGRSRARQRQILATPETFADWLRGADESLHERLGPELSLIHAWLRMAYA